MSLSITKTKKGYDIILTRGDTMTLTVTLLKEVPPVPPATEPTIEPYVPETDDVIRFAVSKGYNNWQLTIDN